jgi:hypothetical protein
MPNAGKEKKTKPTATARNMRKNRTYRRKRLKKDEAGIWIMAEAVRKKGKRERITPPKTSLVLVPK